MESDRAFSLPNGTGSAVFGNSWKLGKDQKHVIGTMAGFTYTRRFQRRADEIIRTYGAPQPGKGDELTRFNDYRAETGIDTVTWSGLGTVSYGYGTDHKIALTGLYSRNAEKEARFIEGFNDEQSNDVRDERLRFVNRAMIYGQLRGDHRFPSINSGELTWNALWARATLNDPNLRETVYIRTRPSRGAASRSARARKAASTSTRRRARRRVRSASTGRSQSRSTPRRRRRGRQAEGRQPHHSARS
jgi:hypothetical protein